MKVFFKIILIGCYAFLLGAAKPRQKKEALAGTTATHYIDPLLLMNEAQSLLKEGDLVLRLNTDPASQYIKNFSRTDKSYSHAGIVIVENGYPYVYHIVNGTENPGEKLRKDSLKQFCNPRRNLGFGIYRYNLSSSETGSLHKLLQQWYAKGIGFDSVFNFRSNDKMYCSEMVSKALTKATHKRIVPAAVVLTAAEAGLFSAYMHLPYSYTSTMGVVPIDNLYLHADCRLVKRYKYVDDVK